MSSRMKSDRIFMLTKFLNPKAKIFVNFHRLSNSVCCLVVVSHETFLCTWYKDALVFSSTLKQKVLYTSDEDDNSTPVFVHNT